MTTVGYKNIPFIVDITMHSAIHAEHQVHLFANDPRLTFPAGGTAMTFTPANWNVAQHVTVNFDGVGDAEMLAAITSDYFVDGAGHHRVRTDIIDLSVTALPIDTWIGSTPQWFDGSSGDLAIVHNNVVGGHKAVIGIPSWTGLGADIPFLLPSTCTVCVDLPDGTHATLTTINPGSTVTYTMAQLGIYHFRIVMSPCWVMAYNAGTGHTIQVSTFSYSITDAGGTLLIGPVNKAGVQSQGASTAAGNTGFSFSDGPGRLPDGPFSVTLPSTYNELSFLDALSLQGGGGTTTSNCTGTVTPSGSTVVCAGVRNNFPFAVSLNRSAIEVHVGGVDTGIRFGAGYNN